MRAKTVTVVWTLVGALFLLSVVTSKPVADESDSVEISSSEEGANEEAEEVEEPELPEATVTEAPSVPEPTEAPATIALPAAIDTTALPADTLDPQTSTDGLQMLPEEPSQTSLGVDVSRDMPETDPAHPDAPLSPDQLEPNAHVGLEVHATPAQANDVQQEVLPKASVHPPSVKGKAHRVAVVKALPVHVNPGVPVCFTFQYAAPHYSPPRGDSY
ncbi:hypothetical protein WMY93_004503 [Mugilogobius chulae]|uniref:Uncharacterized protein n=1 Tax=Mugilogobius chulae TaxID=88201 RepID=A0AAW0PNU4_9GOBI